jgi:hypothetical protein
MNMNPSCGGLNADRSDGTDLSRCQDLALFAELLAGLVRSGMPLPASGGTRNPAAWLLWCSALLLGLSAVATALAVALAAHR